MNAELYFILNLLVLGFSSIVSLFLVLKNKKNLLLLLIVPVVVFCCVNAYNNVHSLLGLSRPDAIPKERVLVLQVVREGKKFIHIWYLDEHVNQPRAIKIPYSEKNNLAAEGISGNIKSGQSAYAEFGKEKGTGTDAKTMEHYNIPSYSTDKTK